MDRDLNAAINILIVGASSIGLDTVIPDLDPVRVAWSLRILVLQGEEYVNNIRGKWNDLYSCR